MLKLGNTLERQYMLRIPFMNNFCHIGIFTAKRKAFSLFSFDTESNLRAYPKVSMHKDLRSSSFCDKCISLHGYQSKFLDIRNQYEKIKERYEPVISLFINETIVFSKININGSDLYNNLEIYGFTFSGFENEFCFIIAERQYINTDISKKIVRTCGIQIASSEALSYLDSLD